MAIEHYIIIFSILFKTSLADDLASDLPHVDNLPSDVASNLASYTKHGGKIIPGAWILYIPAGFDVAKKIADAEGFQNVYEIPGLNLFHLNDLKMPTEEHVEHILIRLTKYEEIKYMAPSRKDQIQEHQEQEEGPIYFCAGPESKYYTSNAPQFFNDPFYPQQWFLRSCSDLLGEEKPTNYDMKIVQAWDQFKVTGKDIVVISADNGVFAEHLELKNRISEYFSKNHIKQTFDPTPDLKEETHGTRCAGIIAAEGNNGICGVGIAPQVTLGAHKFMLKREVEIHHVSETYSYKVNEVHIITSSTGDFEFQAYRSIYPEVLHAFEKGITTGRGGKGVIYVFPSGNGKREKETCSSDGQLQTIYKITVGGAKNTGAASDYAEGCPAVMMVTHSGNGAPYAHVTPDLGEPNSCFNDFNGTSAGTPVAAGILALLLEANNNLSWRDVKYAIAWTSEVAPLAKNPGWTKNGAGFYVHFDFGFGLINAYDLIELGKNFPGTAPPMNICVQEYTLNEDEMWFDGSQSRGYRIPSTGCRGTPQEVNYIEHVHLTVTIEHLARGFVKILLTSPKKTQTTMLPPRRDGSAMPIDDYSFLSVHNWGEQPQGEWLVEIMDVSRRGSNSYGRISQLELTFYGTKTQPKLYANGPRKYLPFSFN